MTFRWMGGALLGLALLGATVDAAFAQVARNELLSESVTVSGEGLAGFTIDASSLSDLPRLTIEEARTLSGGAVAESRSTLTGVLLRDALDRAGLTKLDRFTARRLYFVASATDGYQAVFSWAELYNSATGDGVLIVVERNGKPLPADEGHYALVSLADKRPGPRHVKWLNRVRVFRTFE